jgi:hypothetical protein
MFSSPYLAPIPKQENRLMKRSLPARAGICAVLLLMMLFSLAALPPAVFAQDVPSADTPTPEPATFTPTPTPPTVTPTPQEPTATPTGQVATATAVITPTPPPRVVPIPEPVTIVLFGTGLAALSAAVATRRGKSGKR